MDDKNLKGLNDLFEKIEGYFKRQTEATLSIRNSYMYAYESLRDSPESKAKEYFYIAADYFLGALLGAFIMLVFKGSDLLVLWLYPKATIVTKITELGSIASLAVITLYLVIALIWDCYDKIRLKMLKTSINIALIEEKNNETPD